VKRLLAGATGIGLVLAGLTLAAPRADAATPTGTKATGNTYTILWVTPDPALDVNAVKVAGRWAKTRDNRIWEVVMTGPQRNRLTRKVAIYADQGVQRTHVLFESVPW
jgi:hypothetical protein